MHRYGELRRRIPGISQKMLTQRLRDLEADGLITRHDLGTTPPHVEYRLTLEGASLAPVLNALYDWGASGPSAPAFPSSPRALRPSFRRWNRRRSQPVQLCRPRPAQLPGQAGAPRQTRRTTAPTAPAVPTCRHPCLSLRRTRPTALLGACSVSELVAPAVSSGFLARADDRRYGHAVAVLGDDPPVQRFGPADPRRQSPHGRGPRATA
ncbi:winged helix-turn-helix transcriptional regulator [Micromonospora deserti]|uniref:winged helix-turn-helix transcriptional regulator n=1 Tax=Micromonospora deserti TaxID=2070366 RepID=UPI001F4867AA|nr:winged helix-turn-helix transcriptional regulator [Micromonospora deserti]